MGNGPDPHKLQAMVTALQLNTAGLFALLGGDDNDKLRFWEIRKGITTPAEWRLITSAFDQANRQVEQAHDAVRTAVGAAQEISA